jgi:GntR family transcriptional regulator
MPETINKNSPIPYYIQLKDLLLFQIENNEFSDGKLPSEKELSEKHGLTVTTIRKVLSELQHLGRIYKVKGLGTFIRKPRLELDITKYLSFGRMIKDKGLSEEIEVTKKEVIDSSADIFSDFTIESPSLKIVHIERIRAINKEAIAIEKLYFNNDICGSMIMKAQNGLIYDYLTNELKVNFVNIEEYLEPIILNREDANLLGVKDGTAALLITKISYGAQKLWLEFSNTVIRGDKCRYHVHLK